MASIENIKNDLIDKILISKNKEFLSIINALFDMTKKDDDFEFDSHQIEMLQMGMKDVENGDLISEEELDKLDAEWLN